MDTLFIPRAMFTINSYKALLAPCLSPSTWKLCCFGAEHLEPLHLHMCCLMRCMWRAVGRCPRRDLQVGHLPPAPLTTQQELSCTDTCPALTWTHSQKLWPALLQRRPGWEGKSPVTTELSLHLFADFLGSHWRTEWQAPTPCAVSLQFKFLQMSLFLHTPPSRPWSHLSIGQNKALCLPLPGDLRLSTPLRTEEEALEREQEGCCCPSPSSGHQIAGPELWRCQETFPLSPPQEPSTHGGLSSTLSWH